MANRRQFKINPLDLKRNTAIGVMLPLGGAPMFKLSYTTEDQSISNLKNLLLTRKGERPFQPLFGTDIYSILFENITSDVESTLKESLTSDIAFWLPYIQITKLEVVGERDKNTISISLNVRVNDIGANTPIIVNVSNQGNISIA